MRKPPSRLVVLALALVGLVAPPLRARAIPPPLTAPQQGRLLGLVTADAHGVVVVREQARADFDGRGRCRVEVRYDLRNPGATRVSVVAAFLAAGLPVTRAAVEGDPSAARPLSDYERGAIEAALETHGLAAMLSEPRVSWRGLALDVDAGATRTVVIHSEILTERTVDAVELFVPAIRERHLVLGPDEVPYRAERVHVPTAPALLWGADRELVVESRAPADFRVSTSLEDPADRTASRSSVVSRARGAPPAEVVASATLEDRFPTVSLGGPYVGLGGEVDDGFRMRLGVEFGLGRYLVASANVDTSFDGTWVLAPVLEAATPIVFILPSLAGGAGPVFRFDGGAARAGVRLQATLHLLLGFVVCIDVYPASNASSGFTEATLLGTVGL